ncbi:MAG TPA: isoprenyl transferase [Candidatus Faecaligallichristensenella faecipullorum]|nr:isoprenyl transferase [Candidatus Faecaligallichristensenella faecipullorum]
MNNQPDNSKTPLAQEGENRQAWYRRLFGAPKNNEETSSIQELDPNLMPRHVAIIMDGNGRWAKRRNLPRSAGHKAGTEALRAIIKESDALGIEALTIYAFSTENWLRPKEEVGALMGLLLQYFASEIDELHRKRVCIRILGDVEGLPEAQRRAVLNAMERTRANDGLKLNIALNYGGRAEILRAAKAMAERAKKEGIALENMTEADFERELYTAGLPDVDLLIRTSGEMRLSNFLPWQTSYAEMIFNDTLWPDYDEKEFRADILRYMKRDRRFGKV